MQHLDCTDIQAILSGLIDGELEPETRHCAERHLAGCPQCRDRVNEAEVLDELIAADVTTMVDPAGLPPGFVNKVLSQTVYQDAPRPYLHQWTTWGGWIAAAAALGLAVTIWISDRRSSINQAPVPTPIAAEYSTGADFQSMTLDHGLPYNQLSGGLSELGREDAETLYFASVLLQLLEEDPSPSVEEIGQLRTAMEYDQVLPRLLDLSDRMPLPDRPLVQTAASVLTRIGQAELTDEDVQLITTTTSALNLSRSIDAMSNRFDPQDSL